MNERNEQGLVDEEGVDMSGYENEPRSVRELMRNYHTKADLIQDVNKRAALRQALRITEELDK